MSKSNTETPPDLIPGMLKSECAAHVTRLYFPATRDAYSTHQRVRRGMDGGDLLHPFHSQVWQMGAMFTGPPHWTTRLGTSAFSHCINVQLRSDEDELIEHRHRVTGSFFVPKPPKKRQQVTLPERS